MLSARSPFCDAYTLFVFVALFVDGNAYPINATGKIVLIIREWSNVRVCRVVAIFTLLYSITSHSSFIYRHSDDDDDVGILYYNREKFCSVFANFALIVHCIEQHSLLSLSPRIRCHCESLIIARNQLNTNIFFFLQSIHRNYAKNVLIASNLCSN